MPLLGVLLLVTAAGGTEPALPQARAVRLNERPRLDGTVDSIWEGIPPLAASRQRPPAAPPAPRHPPPSRTAYAPPPLSSLARAAAQQGRGGAAPTLPRRDRDVGSDAIIIDLDTRGSHTGAFHFEVSA